jgi:hypothetical protein
MTTLHETNDEQIKNLYNLGYRWYEDEQIFTVNVTELESACNYYSIMATSVNKIIYDKDFMLDFYCKHQDIARAMLSYKEITND